MLWETDLNDVDHDDAEKNFSFHSSDSNARAFDGVVFCSYVPDDADSDVAIPAVHGALDNVLDYSDDVMDGNLVDAMNPIVHYLDDFVYLSVEGTRVY